MRRWNPFAAIPPIALGGIFVVALVWTGVVAGAFAVDPGATTPEPVDYGETVELGLSTETDAVKSGEAHVPRAQVFYSQFQYVVGYNGIGAMQRGLDDEAREAQLGYPLAVYIETFDTADPTVGSNGLFAADGGTSAWTEAGDAWYVVDSEARTPTESAIVPFESRSEAATFADAHEGDVIDWAALRDRSSETDTAGLVREMAPERWTRADAIVANETRKRNRPVSVVVGEDASTINAALETAPPNTTILVPPGTYEERVTVNRSVTLAGDGATIRGGGNGSVLTVRATDVAITGMTIVGTGNRTERSAEAERSNSDDGWDENIQHAYGYGDAGIKAAEAPGLLVENVTIETNASGILLRGGSDAVIRRTDVEGADTWQAGFMGVTAIESRIVAERSAFVGGRDGVYLHRADGSVIRESTFRENRYGIHTMFSGGTLVADNVVRNTSFGGITVMTQPAGNAIVGNDIRGTDKAISASGTRSYVAYNTLASNGQGFSTNARGSLYEHNVVVSNRLGAKATTVIPSSRLVRNDFVSNDPHASAGSGPLRVWTHEGTGNYWEGANGPTAVERDNRMYSPGGPVDSLRHRERAAVTLAESPAVKGLRGLLGTTPGMRSGSVVDTAPAKTPFHPDRIEALTRDDGDIVIADWRGALAPERKNGDSGSTTGDAQKRRQKYR